MRWGMANWDVDGSSWRTHTKEDVVIQLHARNLMPWFGPPEKRSSGSSYWEAFSPMLCGSGLWNVFICFFFTRILTIPYMANDLSQGKYRDKAGRERFHGTPALKKSQHFGLDHSIYIYIYSFIYIVLLLLDIYIYIVRFIASYIFFFPTAGYCGPRCYPYGFGENLRKAWELHLGTCPGRRDLRFKPQPFKPMCIRAQFDMMPMEDLWEDAKLWEPLSYLFNSKRLRPGDV